MEGELAPPRGAPDELISSATSESSHKASSLPSDSIPTAKLVAFLILQLGCCHQTGVSPESVHSSARLNPVSYRSDLILWLHP